MLPSSFTPMSFLSSSLFKGRTARLAVGVAAGLGVWAVVLSAAVNYGKTCSPLVVDILFNLRTAPVLHHYLGEPITTGYWINGPINHYKGVADINFRVSGPKDNGRIFVNARRRIGPWYLSEVKLVLDSDPDNPLLLRVA
ncbi:hypothetical protein H696_05276 [Fonticula alba]|uniref:DUF1783-domain-containing protein n=1 Tax=Fonticula alba TaxID=691883 RepID=A0A058Z271_FONAL|nr:hypothetical protein H696_05276 [Fonticula alba]KCV68360.1 hypothetical protein H696_05276 [Fonticula alba]|eukprot:XP_009497414.1 hypothetical protein H696_05276 [Fonticula alba]